SVASTVVQTINDQALPARAAELGSRLATALREALANNGALTEVRHCGLMLGLELDRPCAELMALGLERGIVLNVTTGNVLRLLPPLVMSDSECEQVVEQVSQLVNVFTQ
ncbi:MAG: aminotransferase class III-fold pyridoxal phosphate-dependent enzyme, partial [Pseudomonadales bacterium]|nr:aminotransferase class III-fold pyridoxal phosphate-dependent enzyme [Pseudomonadales bacterium]